MSLRLDERSDPFTDNHNKVLFLPNFQSKIKMPFEKPSRGSKTEPLTDNKIPSKNIL